MMPKTGFHGLRAQGVGRRPLLGAQPVLHRLQRTGIGRRGTNADAHLTRPASLCL